MSKFLISVIPQAPRVDLATAIAASGLVVSNSLPLQQDVESHLHAGQVYTVVSGDAPVGFAVFSRFPNGVLYLAGIMLRPNVQGRHICEKIIQGVRRPEDRFLGLRTQSPIMWAAGKRICSNGWLPDQPVATDSELQRIGNEVAAVIGCPTFPVSPGFYGQALYGKKPEHRDPVVQAWWDSLCDFVRGDVVVCVGRF
ncbi:MAG: hypothetical protein Q7R83_00260 [bacterium]|nr:hypothetical protein [bacterium]